MGDIMDAGHSSQTSIASSRDLISPSKGTRTLTVREYEQTISELKKENFDLKLKLFLFDEAVKKNSRKDKENVTPDQDIVQVTISELKKENYDLKLKLYLFDEAVKKNSRKDKENVTPDQDIVQVVVQLSSEADSLRNELSHKDKLLQDALEQAEKFETDLKELEKKYSDLQSELASLSELPSKEEFLSFVEEKENLIRHVELLEKTLLEKEEEISTTNQKIEMLADNNRVLEEKLKKRSIAIQGFVQKNVREKQMLPDELRNLVISATQAAKIGNKEEFAIAVKSVSSALNQMMSLSVVSMNVSEEKENIESPKSKCLKEEVLEKSKSISSCQTESPIELSDIQGLREILSERNIPSTKSFCHLDSVVCDSYAVGKKMKESTVNIAEKDVVDCKNFSTLSPSSQENLITFSNQPSSQTCSVVEQNLIDIEYFPSSPSSSDLIHQGKDISKVDVAAIFGRNSEESNQLMNILKENEQLKLELKDKLGIIEDLQATCKELELTNSETGSDARKASKLYNVYTQTDITESNHLNEYQIERFQKDAELSNNVEELREDVRLLLHSIEDKNKELLEVKQTLSVVQEDLKKALDTTNVIDKDFYVNERNELHEKLALSCSVNEELMKQLKTLERFMEDLLNNKFDSSRESISDKSVFLTSVSRCLNESLELSNVLSKHLSICEGSKLFEDTQSFVQKNSSYLEKRSMPSFSLPELSITERQRHSLSYPGSHKFEEYDYIQKSFDRIQNDSNGSQLCRQCWQQLNRPLTKSVSVTSHQVQNDVISQNIGYPSSESDIWSEPDRDVSMQRIGISLQNSPMSSKSPRKSKLKLKRSSCRFSLDEETTSNERMSKKQNGSASRRLFSRECVKNEDSSLEKFYFLVAEKYSKLKSLLRNMENEEKDLSDEVNIVESLKTAFQQLHIARENAKNFPSVCGNCIMLELFAEIKHYRESDSFVSDSSSEQGVLHQFSEEISSLKDSCKNIFPQLFESFEKLSQYTQCDVVSEVKLEELEEEIVHLNSKNKELSKNLDDLKNLLSTEKEELEFIKTENYKLTSQLDVLKKELSEMKQKESDESFEKISRYTQHNLVSEVKPEELEDEIVDLNSKNRELSKNLDDLKNLLSTEKEKLESIKTENYKLTSQLDVVKKELSEMKQKESFEKISRYTQLDVVSEVKPKELEDEIVDLNSKNKELSKNLGDLKNLLSTEKEKLESIKTENYKLTNQLDVLKKELSEMKEKESFEKISRYTQRDVVSEVKPEELEDEIVDLNSKNKELSKNLDDLKNLLSTEKEKLESIKTENYKLTSQLDVLKKELSEMKQKESFEKISRYTQLDVVSEVKPKELEDEIVDLNSKNKELSKNLDDLKNLLSTEKEELESIKTENYKLTSQLDVLNKELSEMKQKESDESFEKISRYTQRDVVSEELEDEIVDLNSKNKELSKNLDDLKNLLSTEKEKLESIKTENYKLTSQLDVLKKELSEMKQKESDESFEKISRYTQCDVVSEVKPKELEDEILDLNSKNKELSKNLDDLKNLLSTEKGELESIKTENYKLTSQLDVLKKELSEMKQKESEGSIEKISRYTQRDVVSDVKLEELEDEIVDLNSKNKELSKNLDDLKNFLSTEKEKLESIKTENYKLTSQLDVLKKELSEMKQKESDGSIEKISRYTQRDVVSEVKPEELEDEIVDLNSKNKELSKNLDDLKNLLSTEKEELESIKTENYKLASQLDVLKKELSEMKQKESDGSIEKISRYTQRDVVSEVKPEELEDEIVDLNSKNKELSKNLDDLKNLLSTEKEELESIKTENYKLASQLDVLKKELSEMKQRESELSIQNGKFVEELNSANQVNSELNSTLKDLEQNRKESSILLDQLSAELQKNKSDLHKMSEKCIEYEKKLYDEIHTKEECENKLRTLEASLQSEKNSYLNQIDSLNAEKNNFAQELKQIQEMKLSLENENASMKDSVCLKNSELLSLQETIQKLQSAKETLKSKNNELQTELKKAKQLIDSFQNKIAFYEDEVILRLKENESNLSEQLKELKTEELELKEMKLSLENENASMKDSLYLKNKELLSLQEAIQKLQSAKETLKSTNNELQTELKKAKQLLDSFQNKIAFYEDEVILQLKENESILSEQLKELETKSLNEKEKLIAEVSELREVVLRKMADETALFTKLQAEKAELYRKYAESCQNISNLKQLNKESEIKQLDLQKKSEHFEKAFLSSNNECDLLNNDFKNLRETLQNLELKCLFYEKQLVATSGMKDNLVECLLNISNEFLIQRQKLNEMCKAYGIDNYVLWDEPSIDENVPVIDENNVQMLCENICSETKKLSQSIDMLLGLLKSYHLKTIETKEKNSMKIMDMKKQLEMFKSESEQIKIQRDQFQLVISELQNSISEKEKSVQYSACEIQSLKEKLFNTIQDIERNNQLLHKKDDEITMLQERIFNLQTYVNSIMTGKTVCNKRNSMLDKPIADSVSSDNQLPSKLVLRISKSCQTDNFDVTVQCGDDCLLSTSPENAPTQDRRNHCCEKYWNKYRSLQSKLAVCRKHIEILEKEKTDLRENLLQQLQNKQDVSETKDSYSSKLAELESKLEQKKAFISELKGELLKTCNSLIDKEKEVDTLKQKLSELEDKTRQATFDKPDRHSTGSPKSIAANIKTLKNHKWKLIQTIFDIQRKFYEKRGIHLNYFDKFKDHVNNLYSLQLTNSIVKSESLPLLESCNIIDHYEQKDDKIKNLASLELDIECLENLKIFLNRFFVPCVLQTPKAADEKVAETKVKKVSTETLHVQTNIAELKDLNPEEVSSFFTAVCPEGFLIDYNADQTSEGKTLSFDVFASTVSYQLDLIQKFFIAVAKCDWIDALDFSAKESSEKAEVKSLLLHIFQEIKSLHEATGKVFTLNALLKKIDCISSSLVPLNSCDNDVSDKESVMSEETIAVSRSESPTSFEDACPIELPHPETLRLEGETLKPVSTENKLSVIEPYGSKTTAIGSSCDSVCPRSHYSSPDLGIESDPNHDSSAPEQKDDAIKKYQKLILEEQKFRIKSQLKTSFTNTESAGKWLGNGFGDSLYAIGTLQHYELLKQEIKESLVAIKSVLSRTGDGLHHIARYTSPRKTLEYNTLKSIKDTCIHMEVCLKEANNVVGKFWTAPCPTEKEWKILNEENQDLQEQLTKLKIIIQKQENEYKRALGKLEHAQVQKASLEKKISKKLVKTKKVIRQAELKLLENRCQNFPPLPKYPSSPVEQAEAQ